MLSELSQARINYPTEIPEQLERGNISVAAVKKFSAVSEHVSEVMKDQFKTLLGHRNAHYFVEVQDNLLTNRTW